MAFYENVMIIRPDLTSQQAEAIGKKFAEVVDANGGKMIKTENWKLRTLAYRIKKHKKGHYIMLGFEGTGDTVNELERQQKFADDLLRFLTIKVEELTKEESVMTIQRPTRERTFNKGSRPMANRASEYNK
ncbi:MAG: 30S ribosomal protein S6 [Proteobacteria bacterium]|nr:30S ribosomal protein S6 [Pseudomonadota bacterium]